MHICYLDESGDTRVLLNGGGHENITPLFVLAGVAIDHAALETFTREFIEIKTRFYPHLTHRHHHHRLGRILPEIKGADLRRAYRNDAGRNKTRHAGGVIDALLRLLESHEAQIFGRVWIKVPGKPARGRSMYTFSVQDACATFENLLLSKGDHGLIIADSRTPGLNAPVSHSIFTRKFKQSGDDYPRVLELPTFGHSQNHAGLQVADLLCSALIFPMAATRYCDRNSGNVHVNSGYERLVDQFGPRIRNLQYRYTGDDHKQHGGIVVSDPLGCNPSSRLFGVRERRLRIRG